MSVGSFLKSLSPFGAATAAELEKAIADVKAKADAEIVKLRADFSVKQVQAAMSAKQADWNKFKSDYEAYLKSITAASPHPSSAAASGLTGPAA